MAQKLDLLESVEMCLGSYVEDGLARQLFLDNFVVFITTQMAG
jgi:hypothetical protein